MMSMIMCKPSTNYIFLTHNAVNPANVGRNWVKFGLKRRGIQIQIDPISTFIACWESNDRNKSLAIQLSHRHNVVVCLCWFTEYIVEDP